MPTANWKESVERRAALLHQQIAAMQRLVAEKPDSTQLLEEACSPYYQLLDELYVKELPLAKAMDQSDLLLHLEGRDLEAANPSVALVANIFSDMRKQVSGVIRALLGSLEDRLVLPKEIELRLNSFVRGSLYLGFRLPESTSKNQLLSGDPLIAASEKALQTIGALAGELQTETQIGRLNETFPDPAIRDATLNAIYHLAPTGRRGIEKMDLMVKGLPQPRWSQLTPQTRKVVASLLAREAELAAQKETRKFSGVVRQMDLDTRRIQLRSDSTSGPKNIRCIFPPELDNEAKSWLNRNVEVTGQTELYQGKPSLVHINKVRILPETSK